MSNLKTIHLFNCDHLYDLNIIESLLNVVKHALPFKLLPEKHYFNLQDMRSLCEEIKTMHIDYAVFVVHANESRLSINEQNAGIGYGRVFKELLLKTDGKVLVVIGGDSHYESEEEKQQVISDWVRYKISSQFFPESMDGRKSFVFSWNEKHSEVHVQAMKHFFVGTGKFNYKPGPKPKSPADPAVFNLYDSPITSDPYTPGPFVPPGRDKTLFDIPKEYSRPIVVVLIILGIIWYFNKNSQQILKE